MRFQDDDLKVLSVCTVSIWLSVSICLYCLYLPSLLSLCAYRLYCLYVPICLLASLSSLFPYLYLAICLYLPVSSVSGYVPRSVSLPLSVSAS